MCQRCNPSYPRRECANLAFKNRSPQMKREDALIGTIAAVLLAVLLLLLGGCSSEPLPPSTVDVNGTVWRIKRSSFEDYPRGLRGITHCNTRTIEVKALDDNPQEVLVHELSHAMVCGDAFKEFDVNNMYYNNGAAAPGVCARLHRARAATAPYIRCNLSRRRRNLRSSSGCQYLAAYSFRSPAGRSPSSRR